MTTRSDLTAVLREPAAFDALVARHGLDEVMTCAAREGIAPLIAHLRTDRSDLAEWRRTAVLDEAVRGAEMSRVCQALVERGVPVIVFKGGSLAHTHYPHPWCRPRLDLDLLVHETDRARASDVLRALGYARAGRLQGRLVNRQDAWTRGVAAGITHVVDLHWEVTNRVYFIDRLPARDVFARAVPAPFAGDHVETVTAVEGLLLACLHRAAHHTDHMRLIWVRDEWLIARAMSPDQIAGLLARARAIGAASVCARDLREAREAFGDIAGALDAQVIDALTRAGSHEPAWLLNGGTRSLLGDLWLDLRALRRWRDRLRLVFEHVVPPPSYILEQAGETRRIRLPWLYARRLVPGLVAWLADARRTRRT
jgi:hypothetical protein